MDISQQVIESAPAASAGGAMGAGGVIAALKFFKMFASPQDVDLLEAKMEARIAELKAEFAEKYVTQAMLKEFGDNLDYIRHRVDQLADRK